LFGDFSLSLVISTSSRGQEVEMTSLRMQKLDCYQVAKAIAVRVHEARIGDAELRDQATRAAKSTFLRSRGRATE
jgi:hypothetical protein